MAVIQVGNDREISAGSTLHDKGCGSLRQSATPKAPTGVSCGQVTYLSTRDPIQRLYFDIVAVARRGEEWELKSGLCKR
jgi:hypothetical protein